MAQPDLKISTDMANDLEDVLAFVKEAAKLKQITRQTSPIGMSRKENSAEHSWHLSLMAMVLSHHADAEIDVNRVIKMLIVHDLPEVYADDIFIYDRTDAHSEKERAAAKDLFGLLPDHLSEIFHDLWEEFEAGETNEAVFARALDRFQPCFCNYNNGGGTWIEHGIAPAAVLERNAPIQKGSRSLWQKILDMVESAKGKGFFPEKDEVKYG